MTAEPVTTRPIPMPPQPTRVRAPQPARPTSTHALVLVDEPPRAWTLAKIAGLVAITALSAALAAAIVVGGALFAVLTIG